MKEETLGQALPQWECRVNKGELTFSAMACLQEQARVPAFDAGVCI